MKKFFVIVIYNKECENSITINKLNEMNEKNIIVIDNSTISNNNKLFCKKKGYQYYSMGGNVGLSKAYNFVINKLINEKGCIIWLDDDTAITKKYIQSVDKNLNNCDILIPIIRCKERIISPLNRMGIKFYSVSEMTKKKTYAINSCLVVNINVYKDGNRYNEQLFLDNVDIDFFDKLDESKYSIKIVDSNIEQDLFLLTNNDINAFKKRYSIYLKDNYIFNKNNYFRKIQLFFKVIFNSIKYSIKYNDIKIINYVFKEYFKTIKK